MFPKDAIHLKHEMFTVKSDLSESGFTELDVHTYKIYNGSYQN